MRLHGVHDTHDNAERGDELFPCHCHTVGLIRAGRLYSYECLAAEESVGLYQTSAVLAGLYVIL